METLKMKVTPIVGMSVTNQKLSGTITVIDPERGTFTLTLLNSGQQVEVVYRDPQGAPAVAVEAIGVDG